MKITFRGQELELHYSMRIYIIYENIMGEGVKFEQMQSYTSILTLMYSAVVASLQYYKRNSNVTYDEFIDWVDVDTEQKITEFSKWFVSSLTAQRDKIDEVQDKNLNDDKKSSTKQKK